MMQFKKMTVLTAVLLLIAVLTSCGDISKTEKIKVPSEIFTEDEINAAMDAALLCFKQSFDGCTMKEIRYAGDDYMQQMYGIKKGTKDADRIVLLSAFYTDGTGGGGVWEPDTVYTEFTWTLKRDNGGNWVHEDHGY